MSSVTSGAQTKRPLSPFAVPSCDACMAERWHTKEEDQRYHPLSGHGFTKETGWTHLELATLAAFKAHTPEHVVITGLKSSPEAN
jgi:hypothetical protein